MVRRSHIATGHGRGLGGRAGAAGGLGAAAAPEMASLGVGWGRRGAVEPAALAERSGWQGASDSLGRPQEVGSKMRQSVVRMKTKIRDRRTKGAKQAVHADEMAAELLEDLAEFAQVRAGGQPASRSSGGRTWLEGGAVLRQADDGPSPAALPLRTAPLLVSSGVSKKPNHHKDKVAGIVVIVLVVVGFVTIQVDAAAAAHHHMLVM